MAMKRISLTRDQVGTKVNVKSKKKTLNINWDQQGCCE